MTAQLDIFAAAAEDGAIPDTAWAPHYGPWMNWEWMRRYGPHPTWEAFAAHWTERETIEVYNDKKGFRASVGIIKDSSTGLWVGDRSADTPTSGCGGPPSYSPAAYRTREECIAAWKARAMETLDRYRKQHEYDRRRDAEWRKEQNAARLAQGLYPIDEDDE